MNLNAIFDPLAMVALALATWRFAVLLMLDDGPFAVLRRLRSLVGVEHNEDGAPVGFPEGSPLDCIGCMTILCAPVMMAVWLVFPPLVELLAVAGGAMVVNKLVRNGA